MKIRMGFVSNSSSSSYVIFGSYLPKDQIIEYLVEQGKIGSTNELPPPSWDYDSLISQKLHECGYDSAMSYESSHAIIGKDVEGLRYDNISITKLREMNEKLQNDFGVDGEIIGGEICN